MNNLRVIHRCAKNGAQSVEGFGRHWYGRGEQDSASYDDATAVATLSTLWARGLGLTIDRSASTDTDLRDAGEQS